MAWSEFPWRRALNLRIALATHPSDGSADAAQAVDAGSGNSGTSSDASVLSPQAHADTQDVEATAAALIGRAEERQTMPSRTETGMVMMPEVATTSSTGQPGWVTGELPAQYADLASQIAALQDEARKYENVAAVLWRTGMSLTLAVRDLFTALQFETELAENGASYDLRVHLEGGRRLLVEIVGSNDAIDRKSPHIAQVLRALQDEAGPQDRVVVAANAHADMPLSARRSEPVTPDALRIIQGLGANFVATSTLFGIWRYSIKDLPGAKKSVTNLHTQDGGLFR